MDNNNIVLLNLSNYVRPEVKEEYGRKWVLNGKNNCFFEYIIDRKNGSPTNESVLNVFSHLLYGRGIRVVGTEEVYEDLVEIFPKREIRKCLDDYKTFGMYSYQILRAKGGGVAKIMHLPVNKLGFEKMDENGDINNVYYCEDWNDTRKYKPELLPLFKGSLNKSLMVKVVAPYTAGKYYFSDPDYLASLQYAEIEEEISNFSINHIKNGLSFGYVININNGGALTPDEKMEVERKIKNKLTGSENAGKFIISFNDGKEAEVSVVQLNANAEAHLQWESLRDEARQQILTCHGVTSPLLFGLPSATGFGSNADELDTASKLLQDYQIRPKQEIFIDELAAVLELNNLETDLEFIPLRDSYNSTEETEEDVEDETIDDEIDDEAVELAGFNPNQPRAKDGKWTSNGLGVNKNKTVKSLNYTQEHIASYGGQDNYEVGVYIDGDIVGMVEYTIYDNELTVSNIIVLPKYRRKGIGSRLMQYVKQLHPEAQYKPSSKTDLGAKFKHKKIDNIHTINLLKNIQLKSHEIATELIQLGEDLSDDWEIIDERRCDEITLRENDLNTVFQFAQVPVTPRKNSEQDTSLFKIRYKYAGNQDAEREFCSKVMSANKFYRAEDLNFNANYNEDFAPSGDDGYNIFKYKGGVNCKHWWQRVIFLKKSNKRISVNDARKMILALEPEDRKDARWQKNDKEVAQVAEKKNNWWSLKPNYRNSGVTPNKD